MYLRKFFSYVFLLLILFVTFIFILAKSYSDAVFNSISDNFVRLHIVANSDSTEDQILKYEIRDAVINYLSPFLENARDKNDAQNIISAHIDDISCISNQIIVSKNLSYPINVSVGKFKFPTRDYSEFVLPEGNYDALKIDIGEAHGQNWWCVMFPSICIPDSNNIFTKNNSTDLLADTLDSEEFSIITKNSSSTEVKIKFKIIEIFENL